MTGGLLSTTLRYPDEVRKAEDYFSDLPELALAPDMLTLAGHIVDSKAADFDPLTFRDRYEEALRAHLKAKEAGASKSASRRLPQTRGAHAPAATAREPIEDLRSGAT